MNAAYPPVRFPNPFDLDPDDAWEALRADCEEEFTEWQRADYENREHEDFGNFLARKARWNAPNKYGEAMNRAERIGEGK